MKISKIHQCFADRPAFQRALDQPEEFLGPNWKDVLNFWFFIDTLSHEQLVVAWKQFLVLLGDVDIFLKQDLAWGVAVFTLGQDMSRDVYNSCYLHIYVAAYAIVYATMELIGAHKILEQGKSLTFVPMFLNL